MMEKGSTTVLTRKKRGRPCGADQQKLAVVIKILAENPDGIWLRKIAKKAGLHPTTVGNYMDSVLSPLVEDVSLGSEQKPIIRVIKLKSSVIRRLEEGATLRHILQLSGVLRSVGKPEKSI